MHKKYIILCIDNERQKMRTTIDIPEELIREAMRITKSPTKTELIKKALYNIIQKDKFTTLN